MEYFYSFYSPSFAFATKIGEEERISSKMKSTIIELPAWKQKVIITDVFLFTKELKATDLGPLIWFLRFLALTDNSLSVQLVETFSQPPLSIGSRGSLSMYSGSEYPLLINNPCFSLGLSSGSFTYDELVAATDGFSETNLIGEGGFGYVHKGYIRNGQEVAIKQLKDGSRQGEREFRAEVEIISRAHHKHLVSVIGYCIAGTKRLIVYEFVPNNTLEFHLHGIFFYYSINNSSLFCDRSCCYILFFQQHL